MARLTEADEEISWRQVVVQQQVVQEPYTAWV